ncbi:MAG: hypothetical protein QOD55_1995 [Solirubrobacteraceae bacterium]|nr:hypothetical protein [Solirubrobacteraceae bacterium]
MTAVAVERAERALAQRARRMRTGLVLATSMALAALPAALVSPRVAIALLAGALGQFVICLVERGRADALIADLALDPAAYAIPAVRDYGARLLRRRARFGRWLWQVLEEAGHPDSMYLADRVSAYSGQIRAAAVELMAPESWVEPVSVATCRRLLTMAADSPLYNPNVPAVDLGSALFRIRAGIASDVGRP